MFIHLSVCCLLLFCLLACLLFFCYRMYVFMYSLEVASRYTQYLILTVCPSSVLLPKEFVASVVIKQGVRERMNSNPKCVVVIYIHIFCLCGANSLCRKLYSVFISNRGTYRVLYFIKCAF